MDLQKNTEVSWTEKKTNEEILGRIVRECELPLTIKHRKTGKRRNGQKEGVVAPKYQILDGNKDDYRIDTQH